MQKYLKNELKGKLSSYKQQDKKNKIYDDNNFINYDDTVEKLVSTKLKCLYCKEKINIFYKKMKCPNQWTLDRINNDIGHSNENTVISCLKCNLQRRKKNMKVFLFSKQLTISKIT